MLKTLSSIAVVSITAIMLIGMTIRIDGVSQSKIPTAEAKEQRPKALRDLVDAAPVLPPELEADVLLALVERDNIQDAVWRKELLQAAWHLAPSAKYKFDLESTSAIRDSDTGSLKNALLPGLSTAGLELRVITALKKTDLKAAEELFRQMAQPTSELIQCSADRYSSYQAFYGALEVLLKGLLPDMQNSGRLVALNEESIRHISTPKDLDSSLSLLRSTKNLPDSDFVRLMELWSDTLGKVRFPDRMFSFKSIEASSMAFLNASRELSNRGGSASTVLNAFRNYFVTHAGGPRCGEVGSGGRPGQLAPRLAEEERVRIAFNEAIAKVNLSIAPIRSEEIKPKAVGENAKTTIYVANKTDKERKLQAAYSHLRFGTPEQIAINNKERRQDGLPPFLTIEQRSTQEWAGEALQYLGMLESWSQDIGESSREQFHEKSVAYSSLIEITPEGRFLDSVLKSYLGFLVRSPIRRESPPEWITQVNYLIALSGDRDRRKWIEQIRNDGDSGIDIYCRLALLRMDGPARQR